MTSVLDELLAESVRLYPVLYNKADKFFQGCKQENAGVGRYSSLSPPKKLKN